MVFSTTELFGASVVLAFPFLVSKCSLKILTLLLRAEVVVNDLDRAIPSLFPLRYTSYLLLEFHQFIALIALSMVWLVIAIFLKVNRVPERKFSHWCRTDVSDGRAQRILEGCLGMIWDWEEKR